MARVILRAHWPSDVLAGIALGLALAAAAGLLAAQARADALRGGFQRTASFFDAVSQDPVLARAVLIAEPWDLGDLPGRVPAGPNLRPSGAIPL